MTTVEKVDAVFGNKTRIEILDEDPPFVEELEVLGFGRTVGLARVVRVYPETHVLGDGEILRAARTVCEDGKELVVVWPEAAPQEGTAS